MLFTPDSNPGDSRPLAALAQAVNSTERTLMRRCQRDLGTSFAQWRARLGIAKAIAMLEASQMVESIAFDLTHASSSAFVAMFRKVTGETPDEYRHRSGASVHCAVETSSFSTFAPMRKIE